MTVIDRPVELPPVNRASEWRFLGRGLDFWLCATLTFIVLLVQGWNIAGYPTVFDDEGTYLAQAWAIDHGVGMTPYTYWFDHPPLGWMQLAALAWIPSLIFHAPGQLVVAYSRIIMLPFTAASCIFVYVLCRRMKLARWAAALAVVLFGLSPLSVTLQRQIFLDNIAVTWILAAFVLAFSPRKHLWHHVATGVCCAVAVLSKETMLLAVPAVIVALYQNVHRATRKYSLVGFAGAFLLIIIQYPLYAILKGELYAPGTQVSLWTGIKYQLTRPGSGSIFHAGNGTTKDPASNAYTVFHNWLFYDPILIGAGIVAVLLCLLFHNTRAVAIGGVILVLTLLREGYLPSMYIIGMLPFFAICVAGLADRIVSWILTFAARPIFWQQLTRLAVVAALATAAVVYVTPKWYVRDHDADTQDLNAGYQLAVEWVDSHINDPGADKRIVVDDTLWLDMVKDGFKAGRYDIYFFKLDVDPDVMDSLPTDTPTSYANGWKSISYVIATPYMWDNETYTTRMILNHSKVIWRYGTGGNQSEIQIRKVTP